MTKSKYNESVQKILFKYKNFIIIEKCSMNDNCTRKHCDFFNFEKFKPITVLIRN